MSTESEIINFIYDRKFLNIVKDNNITDREKNSLIILHCLVVGYKTVGIRDGGFSLSYWMEGEDNNLTPKMNYYFYTTKNALIENTSRCSNATGRFYNDYFHANGTRNFKEKMNSYIKDLIIKIPQELEENIIFTNVKGSFVKPRGYKDENNYDMLMGDSIGQRSLIEKLFLNSKLDAKKIRINKNIKL